MTGLMLVLAVAGLFYIRPVMAGVIGQFLGWYQAGEGAGFIVSVVVAILLLFIYGKVRAGQSGGS